MMVRSREQCHECDAAADLDTTKCSWRHCFKLFCPCCAWHCHECGDVICNEHSATVGEDTYCLTCADQMKEHFEQYFELLETAHRKSLPCPECGSIVEDMSDPFGDPEVETVYGCPDCGATATKRRQPSEALRVAQALRYCGGPALPPAEYVIVEGTAPVKQRKLPVMEVNDERISA